MKAVISSKGQLVLPKRLRDQDCILPGQQFQIERLGAGIYLLKKSAPASNAGLVDLLLACPYKGWFRPICSESTSTL